MEHFSIGTLINYFKNQGKDVKLIVINEEDNEAFFGNDFIEYHLYQGDFGQWLLHCKNIEIVNYTLFLIPIPSTEESLVKLLTILDDTLFKQ